MPHPQRLHVAVLAYNALAFTQRCVASLLAHTQTNHEIAILDNGSEDGTREWLTSLEHANLRTMRSDRNLGVAGGRNLLLAEILERARGDDLIVFLDNDVEASPNWHEPFVRLFARDESAGVAGMTGHKIVVSADRRTLLPAPQSGVDEVDVVSGYCLWVCAHVAAALDPFDERLGLFWHEDDDYCVRAIARGYGVFCIPKAGITHHGHKSGRATEAMESGASAANQHYLATKWRGLGIVDADGHIIRPARPGTG